MDQHKVNPYPRETAGRLMTDKVPICNPQATLGDAKKAITQKKEWIETINYVYVVDKQQLIGVFSIQELFKKKLTTPVRDVMTSEVLSVHPYTDQERVAHIALEHNIKAVPVIDKNKYFLGVVSSDSILAIVHAEHTEDMLRSVGIRKIASISNLSSSKYFFKRLPWLLLGLAGGFAAAFLVGSFETVLAEELVLAAFMPAIVYMADATGGQSQALFIRSLAVSQTISFGKYAVREFVTSLFMAAVIGILVGVISWLWHGVVAIAVVLFIAMGAAIIVASAIGIGLPWLMYKLKIDPAIASGPFATVVRDIVTLFIYFSVANWLL